tara:strand:- start:640 stop:918 length:279 start_codon:yes stop_codon:yes gene_type:complete
MIYDITRAIHFANKLGVMIDGCPISERSKNADTLRISVPHFQTKDAIDQIKLHLDEIVKQLENEKRFIDSPENQDCNADNFACNTNYERKNK